MTLLYVIGTVLIRRLCISDGKDCDAQLATWNGSADILCCHRLRSEHDGGRPFRPSPRLFCKQLQPGGLCGRSGGARPGGARRPPDWARLDPGWSGRHRFRRDRLRRDRRAAGGPRQLRPASGAGRTSGTGSSTRAQHVTAGCPAAAPTGRQRLTVGFTERAGTPAVERLLVDGPSPVAVASVVRCPAAGPSVPPQEELSPDPGQRDDVAGHREGFRTADRNGRDAAGRWYRTPGDGTPATCRLTPRESTRWGLVAVGDQAPSCRAISGRNRMVA